MLQLNGKRRNLRGFTFLEIMLVVVIIMILASMAVPRFTGRTERVRNVAARNDIKTLSTALSAYEMEVGDFPTTEQGLRALVTRPSNVRAEYWTQQMDEIPTDPWGREYIYRYPGQYNVFDLVSMGRDGREGTDDDINNYPRDSQR